MKQQKKRADQLVVDQGFAKNRSQALALIMAGSVLIDQQVVQKAGQFLPADAVLTLKEKPHPWVSRGGLKLKHGLDVFDLSVKDLICLDIGASTGGFTDVLLESAAKFVYSVDVGYGQLADKLRQDSRVQVLERTNARHLTSTQIDQPIDLVVCDASFISLKKVLPASFEFAKPTGQWLVLIKPQFEVGPQKAPKGVVRDPAVHEQVCQDIREWLTAQNMQILGMTESPVKGPKGNKEFLLWFSFN